MVNCITEVFNVFDVAAENASKSSKWDENGTLSQEISAENIRFQKYWLDSSMTLSKPTVVFQPGIPLHMDDTGEEATRVEVNQPIFIIPMYKDIPNSTEQGDRLDEMRTEIERIIMANRTTTSIHMINFAGGLLRQGSYRAAPLFRSFEVDIICRYER